MFKIWCILCTVCIKILIFWVQISILFILCTFCINISFCAFRFRFLHLNFYSTYALHFKRDMHFNHSNLQFSFYALQISNCAFYAFCAFRFQFFAFKFHRFHCMHCILSVPYISLIQICNFHFAHCRFQICSNSNFQINSNLRILCIKIFILCIFCLHFTHPDLNFNHKTYIPNFLFHTPTKLYLMHHIIRYIYDMLL